MIRHCARIRNEIKKNKPYHLAHTEASFLLKNSTYLARLQFLPPATPEARRTIKNAAEERDGHV